MEWEKNISDWNYKQSSRVWEKASEESKWQAARQRLILGGLSSVAREMMTPVAELYKIQATLGGSGFSVGGPIIGSGTLTKTVKSSEVIVNVTEVVLKSYDDIVENPKWLWGKTIDEIAEILGEGWTRGTYGSDKKGWAFRKGDKIVFGHSGGGVHEGIYTGIRSSLVNKKVVSRLTYKAGKNEKAEIIFID